MALRFLTGFDYYNASQINRVWGFTSSNGTSITPGRFGGQAYGWNNELGFLATEIPNAATVIVGMAFKASFGDTSLPIIVFQDATTSTSSPVDQVDIRITADSAFQASRNGAVIAVSDNHLFDFNFWNFLEVKTFINASSGFVTINLNGSNCLDRLGIDTQASGNNYVNMIRIQPFASGPNSFQVDDLYICDDVGSINNTFLGECRVQTQYPTANGETDNFAAVGASTNYQAVDETVADDDTSYVRSNTVGNVDDYAMGTIALSGTIYGVQVNVTHRKDDVGVRTITPIINSFSTYFEGDLFTCQSDYTLAQKLWELEPKNLATWTNTTVNQVNAGLKIKA